MRIAVKSAVVLCLLLCTAVWAQPKMDAAARAKEIAPFVNAGTIAVIHGDMSGVDIKAIQDWTTDLVKKVETDPAQQAQAIKETQQKMEKARTTVAALQKAGATHCYIVIDPTAMRRDSPLLVVSGGDADAVSKIANGLIALPPVTGNDDPAERMAATTGPHAMVVVKMKGSVVVGTRTEIQALETTPAVERPELAEALSAGGDSAVQVMVIPGQALLALVGDIAGNRPLPAALGGGPVSDVTGGIKWLTLSSNLPPHLSLKVVVQSPDGQSAHTVSGIVQNSLAWLSKQGPEGAKVAERLTPTLKGSQMAAEISAQDMGKLIDDIVPALVRARQEAKRRESIEHIRQLLLMCAMGRHEHRQWPADLEQAVAQSNLVRNPTDAPRILTNPCQPQHGTKGYIYVKPTGEPGPETVVIYEAYDKWPGDGISVGFGDGHAESVLDEAKFKKMLAGEAVNP